MSSSGDSAVKLIPLLLPLILVAFVLWAYLSSSDTRVSLEAEHLVVTFRPRDWFFCVSRGLNLPVAEIAGVTLSPTRGVPRVGFRVGTALPSLRAGTFAGKGYRDFWNVGKADTVLVIVMTPGSKYRRVVLQVDDPQALIQELRPVLGAWTAGFSV